jgi:CRISPR-associated protein Csx10
VIAMQLSFTIRINTDYHISAGRGIGPQVDSALLRDGDGVPALRGSTIEGLLRDALWRLLQLPPLQHQRRCRASGSTNDGAPSYCVSDACPFCSLFGTPARPKVWRFSSGRPIGTEKPLGFAHWRAGQTGAQVVARVRVNPRTRRAETRKLFKQEEGDKRLEFTFTATSPVNDPQTHDDAALLVAAARMIRRLGSSRRRGRGESDIKLVHADGWSETLSEGSVWQDHLLRHFQRRWIENQSVDITFISSPWAHSQVIGTDALRFRLLVRADEPIVIARRAEAGNIFDGTISISGTTLLGALAGEAAARYDLSDPHSQVYKDFARVFRRGDVRFHPLDPAYVNPNSQEAFPSIPAPLDLLVCKVYQELNPHHSRPLSYAVQPTVDEECPVCENNIPLVPLGGFVTVEDAQSHMPRQREEMHPAINPHTQRAATGGLFGYVALESGQYFMGEIWCSDEGAWDALHRLTGILKEEEAFNLRLGKATRRGYGLVTGWLKQITNDDVDPWLGKSLDDRVTDPAMPITLTLLTDAILQDEWGRFRQTLDDCRLIEDLLNEPFKPNKPFQIELDEHGNPKTRAFCKAGYVDNFNNKLGLPRWRDIALKAGSAVGFELDPPTGEEERKKWFMGLIERLKHLEDDGIGLRRNEGFGQIAFNHPVYKEGADVSGTSMAIANDLQLAIAPTTGAAAMVKSDFDQMKKWADDLRDEAKFTERFRDKRWDAVARWLHNSADQPIADLQKELGRFGDPALLTTVTREPKQFFAKREVESAVGHLREAVDVITRSPEAAGLLTRIEEVKDNIERFKRVDDALEFCEQIKYDIENIEGSKPAIELLKKAEDSLRHLNGTTRAVFELNDWLDKIADKPVHLRKRMIQLLADSIAAAEK